MFFTPKWFIYSFYTSALDLVIVMHEDAMYQVHAINLLVLLWKLNRFEVLAKWCSLL